MRLSFKLLLLPPLLLLSFDATSQKSIDESEETWFGYFNQTRFTHRSGLWLDAHLRLTDHYLRRKTFAIIRGAYMYHVNDRLRLMGGYTYANRYNPETPRVPEHRPWQQLQLIDPRNAFVLTHALRTEQRFRGIVENGVLSDRYNFNWRFRYGISLTLPLRGREVVAKTPFLLISTEIMANAGKSIRYNRFDQYRIFGGFGYQFTPELSANLGHLFILQHQDRPSGYLHVHTIRLYVIHNLDLRKNSQITTPQGRP
jgi:hypothetical protein